MNAKVRQQIAARIKTLIGSNDLAATARYLDVDEVALRMSLDPDSPYPTVDVIASVVHGYAVDPTWLLTGEYDEATHRHMLEKTTDEIPAAIRALVKSTEPVRAYGFRLSDEHPPV